MEQVIDIQHELDRIEALPLDQRASALEVLESTLRAELDDRTDLDDRDAEQA